MPDKEILKKVAQWISFANDDILFAEHGMKLESNTPYRLVAYHAQQCAEKYLKAFLVFHGVDFPYTHNIAALLELCADYADLPETIHDAEELSQFAVSVRYPGEDEAVDQDEALRSIELARHLIKIIRPLLPL